MTRTDEQRARNAAAQRERNRRNADKIREYRTTDEYRARNAERMRRNYAENRGNIREKTGEKSRDYRARYPERVRSRRRERDRRRRGGAGIAEFVAERTVAQGGVCYLCGALPVDGKFCVDHDHTCSCGSKSSCSACRRGLACHRCNRLIGMADDDPDLLRRIADALEAVLGPTRARIAAKPPQLSLLDEESG